MPVTNPELIEKLNVLEQHHNPESLKEGHFKLTPANDKSLFAKFKEFGLNVQLLDFGLPVKMPEMEPGKEYEVKLRKTLSRREYAYKELGESFDPNATEIEDEAFAQYKPGWQTNAPPFDARFPHQNQKPNCERNYIDYHRCLKIKGEDYPHCNYFKSVYMHKCSSAQISQWDDEIEAGTFRHKI